MSADKTSSQKLCPTCGTRLSENATRCPVCGRALTAPAGTKSGSDQSVRGPRMPEITLSLPAAIGLLILLLGLGAGGVYAFTRPTPTLPPGVPTNTLVVTSTVTPTITLTPTATNTGTPVPTGTPLPPKDYVVKLNDTCGKISLIYGVSINTIILFNNLNADCTNLSVGQHLLIPQPTATATLPPTATANAAQATEKSCDLYPYQVKDGDTLGGISASFNVAAQSIKEWNGLSTDTVYSGQKLNIPLCKRLPTPGPTPTATPPPPYPAANLLLPADGASFVSPSETIVLQWSSVGILRQNELYAVSIENLTDGSGRKVLDYVTDTKYTVPAALRPSSNTPNIFRWTIFTVRQTGSTKDGQPIYEQGGAVSTPRVFSWIGGGPAVTPTP